MFATGLLRCPSGMTHLSRHNLATSHRLSCTWEMVRVLSTVVPVLLLCCWYQLGCTKAVAPVARSSVTVAMYVSEIHRSRRRRQTTECEDVFVEKKATTIKGEAETVNVSSVQACKKFCLRTHICRAVVYASGKCAYAVADELSKVTGNDASTTTYFKVAYRCPRHFQCSNFPCKNGATCKHVASGVVGVECVCVAGWKSWFCEEKAEDTKAEDTGDEDTGAADTGMSDNDKTLIAAAIVGGVVVTGVAATIAVVKATGATAASTAGTAAAWYG